MSGADGAGGAGKGKGGSATPSATLAKPAPLPPWADALAGAPDITSALGSVLPGVFETMKYMAQETELATSKLGLVEQAVAMMQSEAAQADAELGRVKGTCTDLDQRLTALQAGAASVAATHQQHLLDAGAWILNDEAIITKMRDEVGAQMALQREQLELVVSACKLELDGLKRAIDGLQQQQQHQQQQQQQQQQQ